MTEKERIRSTILHKSTDVIPWSFDLTRRACEKIAGHYAIDASECKEFIGDNILYLGVSGPEGTETVTQNTYRNEFGVLFNKRENALDMGDWGEILDYPLKDADLTGYVFPDTRNDLRFRKFPHEDLRKSQKYIILAPDGLFDLAWHLTGFQNFMMYMAGEEEFSEKLLDRCLEYNLGLIENCPDYVDAIRFGEDWGLQKGLMMGPAHWRHYLKPRLKEMYEAARKRGFAVFIHSCGDISELFPDLIEIGVQAVNPIQPEVMDIYKLKKEYGKDLVLYGGVSCQKTLPLGTPEDVKRECSELLERMGKEGGYIFGPSGAIPTDAKTENIAALIDFVKENLQK